MKTSKGFFHIKSQSLVEKHHLSSIYVSVKLFPASIYVTKHNGSAMDEQFFVCQDNEYKEHIKNILNQILVTDKMHVFITAKNIAEIILKLLFLKHSNYLWREKNTLWKKLCVFSLFVAPFPANTEMRSVVFCLPKKMPSFRYTVFHCDSFLFFFISCLSNAFSPLYCTAL